MQQQQNNDLRKIPSEKRKGFVGTAVIHAGLFVLMLIIGFSTPPPVTEEMGILVNFGTDETGLGIIEPSPAPAVEELVPPPPSQNIVTDEEEPLLTQNIEEAPEVKKVDPDAERKRREQIEAERIRREELEAERRRKEEAEAERRRIEAEQKRQEEIASKTRAALAGAKNAGTSSTSEGVAGGPGNQGSPTGSVDSQNRGEGGGLGDSGISYSLEGRGVQKLPRPKYNYQEGGRVVVEVSVDRSGRVTQATAGIKGSTTLNENLLRVAREAALETRFDPKPDAPPVQKGSITYNFILK
ncbi:MAG: energy transducer TonB family protein [Bacteroidales bacterium]